MIVSNYKSLEKPGLLLILRIKKMQCISTKGILWLAGLVSAVSAMMQNGLKQI